MNLFSLDLGLGFGFGLWVWAWDWETGTGEVGMGMGFKIYPWTGMEMKIIPANRGEPGMDGVFLTGYGDGDYTPHPRSGPLPSLLTVSHSVQFFLNKKDIRNDKN